MADRGRSQAPVQPAELRERRAAAGTHTSTVVEAQLATAHGAGGAAGPKTLPETLNQGFKRRAHGAGGSGRREFTRSPAPPDLRPRAGRHALDCCARRHVHLRNTPITRPATLTSGLRIGS